MLSTVTFLAGFLPFSGMVFSATASLDQAGGAPGLTGYIISPVQWELPVKADDPNGKKVAVTGTIQDAMAKMDASYPGWSIAFISTPILASSDDPEKPESVNCTMEGEAVSNYRIDQGIDYLRRVSGTAKNGSGPQNCGRVSCSYGAAIYWCNEDTVEKELQWGQIADGARDVILSCQVQAVAGSWKSKGRANFKEKWNVFVRHDNC